MRYRLLLTILCLLPGISHAQTLPAAACGETETFIACLNRFKTAAIDDSLRASTAAVEDTVNEVVASRLTSGVDAATTGNLRDTLSDFFTALNLGTVSNEKEAITLNFNPEIWRLGPSNKLSLQVVLRQPELYAPLVQMLPEEGRADRTQALEKQIGDLDDVTANLSWSRESEHFGRVFKTHRHLIGELFAAAVTQASSSSAATTALLAYLPTVDSSISLGDSKQTLKDRSITLPADFESQLLAFAREAGESVNQVAGKLQQGGFFRLAELINNQPQLMVTASYRGRDDLAGPDEFAGTFTYEQGWANLNTLRKFHRDRGGAFSLATLTDFLRHEQLIDGKGQPTMALTNAPRLSASLAYKRQAAYRFALPEDGVGFDLDASESLIGSLGLGFYLNIRDGVPRARFDLEAKYEDVDGDMQQSRFVATAMFNQRLTDSASVSLGLVWANRPQFRGEVDEEISARVGLKYGLEWGKAGK